MNPAPQVAAKLATAPLDIRLALTFNPEPLRAALSALWAVYREIREIPVECRDPGVAEVKLRWWEEEIGALYAGKPRHPMSQALWPHLSALVGKQPVFADIIMGARVDIVGPSLPSFEDVKRYCYRHSGSLAELSALLGGASSKEALLAARLLGNSYRLADIALTGTAAALQGRLYFAAEDLRAHGVDKHIHGDAQGDATVRALVQDYAGRARAMHAEALAALPAPERGSTLAWQVMTALAMRRLDRLERKGFSADPEAVESHPLPALFTAWRAARRAR